MSVLVCITNDTLGRGCTIRSEHLTSCVWGQLVDEAEHTGKDLHDLVLQQGAVFGVEVRECRGCLPRPAETGLLCRSCWEKFEAALTVAVDVITHLRSVERGPSDATKVRSAPGSRVILPASWAEADSLWMALAGVAIAHAKGAHVDEPDWAPWTSIWHGFSQTATLDEVAAAVRNLIDWVQAGPQSIVSRAGGAEAAVRFYRTLQRAQHSFPMDEKPTPIRYLRCRRCEQFAVVDRPPLHYLEPRIDVCENCGFEADPQMREWDLKLYRVELEAAIAVAKAEREAREAKEREAAELAAKETEEVAA